MEKKTFKFKTFDGNGNEINLNISNIVYDITENEVECIRLGMLIGLQTKYKNPKVTYEIANDDYLSQLDEILEEDW